MQTAWNSVTLLLSMILGRSSRVHPMFIQGWCMQVIACQLILAQPCLGVQKRTSVMSPFFSNSGLNFFFILFGWLVREEISCRTAAVFWCVCFQDLSKTRCSIFVKFSPRFFSPCVSLPSRRCNYTIVLTPPQFRRNLILFYQWSVFHIPDNQPINVSPTFK